VPWSTAFAREKRSYVGSGKRRRIANVYAKRRCFCGNFERN